MADRKEDKKLLDLLKRSIRTPCFERAYFEAYLAGELPEGKAREFEWHLQACGDCRQELENVRRYMEQCLQIMKQELRSVFEEEPRQYYRLAASSKDQEYVEVRLGRSYGLAVDVNSGMGFVIRCVAKVSARCVDKGRLVINAEQVSSQRTPPFDFIKTKLTGLFVDQYLAPLELNNRYVFVEIEPLQESAIFHEAKSLTLAIVMAIVSAATGKEIVGSVAFSARVEQGGALHPPIADVTAKLEAAKGAGIRSVVLPQINRDDCPEEFLRAAEMKLLFFSHLAHVLEHFDLVPKGPFGDQSQVQPGVKDSTLQEEIPLSLFSGPGDMDVAFKLADRAQVSPKVLTLVMEVAEDLSQAQSELKPITTALMLGDPDRIVSLMPESEMKLKRANKTVIEAVEDLRILSTAVNGIHMCFLVDPRGRLHSIRKIIDLRADYDLSPLLPDPDMSYATVSEVTKSFIFAVMPKGNRVHLFCDGELVAKYLNGQWMELDLGSLKHSLDSLAQRKRIGRETLYRLMKAGFKMSNEGLGALFVIHDEHLDITARYDDRLERLGVEFSQCKIQELAEEELINYAKEDGAMIIDNRGAIRTIRAYLKPSSAVTVEFEKGVGARHMSAQRFSAEVQCICIVVSEDGSITIYCDGKRVWRL